MSLYHAVVWIDHQNATVWQFSATQQTESAVHAKDQHQRVHDRRSSHGGHKTPADPHFFEDVAKALSGVHEILLIGPAQAKHEFATFLNAKHAQLGKSVVAIENADHPTDAQVLSYAQKHFRALDMAPHDAPK